MACDYCGAKKGHIEGCSKSPTRAKNTKFISITCPTCKGSGKRGNRQCGLCDGVGKIRVIDE